MGLDMYLRASKYVGGWSHNREPLYPKLVELVGVTPDEGSPSFTLTANVGYWRKANAIHAWFVKNVQDGRDLCQESYVSRDHLEQLRADCRKVLDSIETVPGKIDEGYTLSAKGRVDHFRDGEVVAQKGVAAAVLPTQGGFFFGKTDYDEDYLNDLRETVEIIDRVLSSPVLKDWDFKYHASW